MKLGKLLTVTALATGVTLGAFVDSAEARGSGGRASGSLIGDGLPGNDPDVEVFYEFDISLQKEKGSPQTFDMAIKNFTVYINDLTSLFDFDFIDNEPNPLTLDLTPNLLSDRLEYSFTGENLKKDLDINEFTLFIDNLSEIDFQLATTSIEYIDNNRLFSLIDGVRISAPSYSDPSKIISIEQNVSDFNEGVFEVSFVPVPESSNTISLLTLGFIGAICLIKHRI